MNDRSIKLEFIRIAQEKYMQDVVQAMEREIVRVDAIKTGQLSKSLKYRVHANPTSGTSYADLYFAKQGRFLDMGVGKSYPLSGPTSTARLSKGKRRKPKKIYSKIVYGKLNALINDLHYGFTEEIKREILSLNNKL